MERPTSAEYEDVDAQYHHEPLVSLIRRLQVAHQHKKRKRASTSRAVNAASFYVPTLPNQPPGMKLSSMFSGHLPASYGLAGASVTTTEGDAISDAHLFFLLVKAKHIAGRQKLVLWFNGGAQELTRINKR